MRFNINRISSRERSESAQNINLRHVRAGWIHYLSGVVWQYDITITFSKPLNPYSAEKQFRRVLRNLPYPVYYIRATEMQTLRGVVHYHCLFYFGGNRQKTDLLDLRNRFEKYCGYIYMRPIAAADVQVRLVSYITKHLTKGHGDKVPHDKGGIYLSRSLRGTDSLLRKQATLYNGPDRLTPAAAFSLS